MSIHENRMGTERTSDIVFQEVFQQRLNSLTPLIEDMPDYRTFEIKGSGSARVIKRGYALVLSSVTSLVASYGEAKDPISMDIWLQDPQEDLVGWTYPHQEVINEFRGYLKDRGHMQLYDFQSALIYEDEKKNIFLAVGGAEEKSAQAMADERWSFGWVRLIDRYGLSSIIGTFPKPSVDQDSQNVTNPTRSIISDDLIGRTRVNDALRRFGEKYSMTNSQFMRFRILANTSFSAGQPTQWDKLAESVISEG